MSLLDFGCQVARTSVLAMVMESLAWVGHGVVDAALGAALLAAGVLAGSRRLRRAGLAALGAVVVSGLLANLGKLLFEMPRPTPGDSFGFPSGHATTAFALAGALSRAFPAAAPFFFLLAVLAGVARLYERSHFVIDVLGGGLLGSLVGFLAARLLLDPTEGGEGGTGRTRWAWAFPIAVAVPALLFFGIYERGVEAYRLRAPAPPVALPRDLVITFGTREARSRLLEGWSEDGRWGSTPIVWSEGRHSTLSLPPLPPEDHRLRLTVRPFVRRPGRAPCQVVEVALNGAPVARLLLEKGWNDYELKVPGRLLGAGESVLEFGFAYAEPESAESAGGRGARTLSAAFALLEAFPEAAPGR